MGIMDKMLLQNTSPGWKILESQRVQGVEHGEEIQCEILRSLRRSEST